ncbi:hypothetical protein GLI01_23270 [Gluconacetobacter liquefaciens]|uniref:hypothetical protein n=1 Tax=Gluconacetobacter liquefaciens TaxID=89584 RepID=UPI001141B75B|nr:hypothetical protein [Gluconacetobacter liquefaciens]GEB38292.1 hypothetical protein GLI01_23270 [Gluconacetobacter liquefaciens]
MEKYYVFIETSGENENNKIIKCITSQSIENILSDIDREEVGGEQKVILEKNNDEFLDLYLNYMKSSQIHLDTSRQVIFLLESFRRARDDKKIRRYVEEHGEQVWISKDNDKEVIYSVNEDSLMTISRNLRKSLEDKEKASHFPGMFLSGLISSYDAYLSDLIRIILNSYPKIIDKSEKNITAEEIFRFSSIDDVKVYLIDRQIDKLMRGSHKDQIRWISDKMHFKMEDEIDGLKDFIEICERRNLYTHTNSIVSSQYVGVCKENSIKTEFSIGDFAKIDRFYYNNSVNVVISIFISIFFNVYSKINKTKIPELFSTIDESAYELMLEGNIKTSSAIYRYINKKIESNPTIPDSTKKRITINYANALKLGGKKEEAVEIINKIDWETSTENYKICVASIKDDVGYVIKKMKIAVESCDDFDLSCFKEWPVFKSLRKNEEFITKFEEVFGEKLHNK